MFRILLLVGFLAAPHLWDDAIHATGVKRDLWITGGLIGMGCIVIFLVWALRLPRSQKIDPKPANAPSTPVGLELANAVADRLDAGNDLAHGHAYYCGMGLTRYGETYIYASVNDGEVDTPEYGDRFHERVEHDGGKVFESRAQFVAWLSVQTDNSLHGNGNQCITLERLQSFASFVAVCT